MSISPIMENKENYQALSPENRGSALLEAIRLRKMPEAEALIASGPVPAETQGMALYWTQYFISRTSGDRLSAATTLFEALVVKSSPEGISRCFEEHAAAGNMQSIEEMMSNGFTIPLKGLIKAACAAVQNQHIDPVRVLVANLEPSQKERVAEKAGEVLEAITKEFEETSEDAPEYLAVVQKKLVAEAVFELLYS